MPVESESGILIDFREHLIRHRGSVLAKNLTNFFLCMEC